MQAAARHVATKHAAARAYLGRLGALLAAEDPAAAPAAAALAAELAERELRFGLEVAPALLGGAGPPPARRAAEVALRRQLAEGGYEEAADALMARAAALAEASRLRARAQRDLRALRGAYPDAASPAGRPAALEYDRCACGEAMAVDQGDSELRCPGCGAVRELLGIVFDDSQFYCQEGQKAKSGSFSPNRHFVRWWTRILAQEPERELADPADPEGGCEALLARLRAFIRRDGLLLRCLTVNDVRDLLEEAGRTDLNKNVALLLKKLTGLGPPAVSADLTARVANLFSKVIEARERLPDTQHSNRKYYPFYIYKIVEAVVPEDDVQTRRLLFYIYMQSGETVRVDDVEWALICELVPELTYRPTARLLGLRYRP